MKKKSFLFKVLFFSLLLVLPLFNLFGKNNNISISKVEVFKRNKASCKRLGNIYDACQWMTRITVKNNSNKKVGAYCFNMKVNSKVYQLCFGKNKKYSLSKDSSKTFLINLTEKMNINIDEEKPSVRVLLEKN
tara:strand:- start:104 stop:502 length:399 start_codon:yes stop_codon:yes gene_type:complete